MSDNPNDNVYQDPNTLGREPNAQTQEPETPTGHIDPPPVERPEKFVGKSMDEVIEIYKNLESEYTKVTSELSTAEKAKEAQSQQLQNYSVGQSPLFQQPPQSQQPSQPVAQDPYNNFEESYEENPAGAIKSVLQQQEQTFETRQRDQYIAQQQTQAEQVYAQKRANPDYVRREPLMQNIARQVLPMIKPEHQNNPLLLELLDQTTQGLSREYYEQKAVKQAQDKVQQQVSDKRQARSETGGGSEGFSDTIDSATMPLEDLAKWIGRDNS